MGTAFEKAGEEIPGYILRDIVKEVDSNTEKAESENISTESGGEAPKSGGVVSASESINTGTGEQADSPNIVTKIEAKMSSVPCTKCN